MPAEYRSGSGNVLQPLEMGCYTPTPAMRKFTRPNFKNVNIDKLDSCNEVAIGLFSTIGVTLAIWALAIPLFDIAGMSWMRGWEGSGMNMPRLKYAFAQAGVYEERMQLSMVVDNLNVSDFLLDCGDVQAPVRKSQLEATMKRSLEENFGSVITDADFEATLSDAHTRASTCGGRRLAVGIPQVAGMHVLLSVTVVRKDSIDRDTHELQQKLNTNLDRLKSNLEMDLTSNDEIRSADNGAALVVRLEGTWGLERSSDTAFGHLDINKDGFVTWDEFSNRTQALDEHINPEEARHAFAGLDENQDGTLEKLELREAFGQPDLFHWNSSSFTTAAPVTTTTVTSTNTSTATSTTHSTAPVQETPVKPWVPTTTTTAAPTTTRPPSGPTAAATTTTPPPAFASVELRVKAIMWAALVLKDREGFSTAYRSDLAYASGILSTQVYDEDGDGRGGCVTLGETENGELYLAGCLRIPEGATEADIEAVVTSGTEMNKIVRDFLAVDANVVIGMRDVKVSVTSLSECKVSEAKDKNSEDFCGSSAVPTATATATTTIRPHAVTTPHAAPSATMTMSTFLEHFGATEQDAARDIFAILDANGNELGDYSEFLKVTMDSKQMNEALTEAEAIDMFEFLDENSDGRVESLEFFEAYTRARETAHVSEAQHGPISLSQYRQSLGHEVVYTKVGVGLCRTADASFPVSTEHPEGRTKLECQSLCDDSEVCGAFAFKVGGICRIYPSTKMYTDTTPMTDVECFTRGIKAEARYDLVRVSFDIRGPFTLEAAESVEAEKKLAETLAFEVGEETRAVKSDSGVPGMCSFRRQGGQEKGSFERVQAICFLDVTVGERLEDISAVLTTASTKAQLAVHLGEVAGMPKLEGDDFEVHVGGTSLKFRNADVDNDGFVAEPELVVASKDWMPPLTQEAAEFAMKGLDLNKDKALSPNEFEAENMDDFFGSVVAKLKQ